MFKFKIGQHVWFLIGSLDDNEDPDFLHGTITRCYTEDLFHGSPDAYYEIGVDGDGFYDREERDLYGSLSELQKAVAKDLRGDVQYFDKESFRLKEQLMKTRAARRMAKKRLDNWLKRCENEK
jgi:hypothetical protein